MGKIEIFCFENQIIGKVLFICGTDNVMHTIQPDLYIGSLRLSEPGVALTGLFIGILCFYAWRRLRRIPDRSIPQQWMVRFFGNMAVSATIGPVFGHALNYWAGFPGKYACWVFSMLSLAALAQAAIEHARPLLSGGNYRALCAANFIALAIGLVVSGVMQSFPWVEGHSAIILFAFVAPLEALVFWQYRDRGSRLLLGSLPLAVLAVLPHVLKWSPAVWFTYYDVGHVVLYACFWVMMLGAEQMGPPVSASRAETEVRA